MYRHVLTIVRRQWHPTPVLLPRKSHGWRSLVGCSPWGREELDTTEWLHFHFHALEKQMATHSSVLAWRIPGIAEPGGLPSMGSHRIGHDWSDLAATIVSLINLTSIPIDSYHFFVLKKSKRTFMIYSLWPHGGAATVPVPEGCWGIFFKTIYSQDEMAGWHHRLDGHKFE